MADLTFKYTILYVSNVAETLKFYESAFGFKTKMLHESGDYGELNTGSTTLSFSSLTLMKELGKQPAEVRSSGASFEIALETADVSAALSQAIKAGAELVSGTEDMPWGQTIAYIRDMNGFLIELCTPVVMHS
jgi:lactoylglutathione lyase